MYMERNFMSEVSSILNKLFVKGLNRDEFIAKYRELAEKSKNTDNSSIFLSDISDEKIGLMFDSFHSSFSGDEITEEDYMNEIKSTVEIMNGKYNPDHLKMDYSFLLRLLDGHYYSLLEQ